MNFSFVLFMALPVLFILGTILLMVKAVKKGVSKKKALILQIVSVACAMGVWVALQGKVDCASAVAQEQSETSQSESVETKDNSYSMGYAVGLAAAALVAGLACISGGMAVAAAAPAAIAATSENPKLFVRSIIFVALGEGIPIYGILVSIMILSKLG